MGISVDLNIFSSSRETDEMRRDENSAKFTSHKGCMRKIYIHKEIILLATVHGIVRN